MCSVMQLLNRSTVGRQRSKRAMSGNTLTSCAGHEVSAEVHKPHRVGIGAIFMLNFHVVLVWLPVTRQWASPRHPPIRGVTNGDTAPDCGGDIG